MPFLPPIPAWESLHVLVIHFPIALLMVAPVLIVPGLIFRTHARGFFLSALTIMALGLISVYVAMETGEAAAGAIDDLTPQITDAIENHSGMAEKTRNLFTVLTAIYLGLLVAPPLMKKNLSRKVEIILNAIFIVIYCAALPVLIVTAHRGGVLVHGFGVHATLTEGSMPAPPPASQKPIR